MDVGAFLGAGAPLLLNVVMVKLQGLLVLFNGCQSRTFSAIVSPDGKLPEGREDVLTIVVFLGLKRAVWSFTSKNVQLQGC